MKKNICPAYSKNEKNCQLTLHNCYFYYLPPPPQNISSFRAKVESQIALFPKDVNIF